jgi:hypothetical protein
LISITPANAATIPVRRGSPNSRATSGAAAISTTLKTADAPISSVRTVPFSRSPMSGRTTRAAPSHTPVNTLSAVSVSVASANRPKSSGASSRARTIVVPTEITRFAA